MSDPAVRPRADERQVVNDGGARFTVLTPALIRMEWSAEERFEDRASQLVINRRLDPPPFEVIRDGDRLRIVTAELELAYTDDGQPFHAGNLAVRRLDWSADRVWTPGLADTGNLLGTARTLDEVSGATTLEPGLLSRDGWTIVDDSMRLVFDDDGPYAVPTTRPDGGLDWYFFGHGRDYRRALSDFTRIAGRAPLPPRYALGAWWSRYWAYTDEELRDLVRQHDEHGVPLDVLVVDMDWHLDGWTGYTWNPACFPDPDGFLAWCHEQSLRVTLNLHPADGVHEHEAPFEAFARRLGVDPNAADHVPFDCASEEYLRAYFEVLHHPLERQGVDFWWIDWQQGEASRVPGLDPLRQLNHAHWRDMECNAERAGRRQLILSRWSGLGSHRYPIGFSGDTHSDWASLAYQPFFTATASNVAFGCWSHDIGGHYHGPVEPELYLRWIQLGALSPVLRTHTSKNPEAERRIWAFPSIFEAARDAFRLRYRLLPYLYGAARQAYDTGVGMCRPLYYDWPERDEAYDQATQYMLGDDLLVAPVVVPVDETTGTATTEIWLPPGRWCDFFTGALEEGDRVIRRDVALAEIPVYARAGAIIPMAPPLRRTDAIPAAPLVLRLFSGADGEAVHYEDDGETERYRDGAFRTTRIRQRGHGDGRRTIEIDAAEGVYSGMAARREVRLVFSGVRRLLAATVHGRPIPLPPDEASREDENGAASVSLGVRETGLAMRVEIESVS